MKKWMFISVVGLQMVFLLAVAGFIQAKINSGQVVVLKVVPVDPRSLFMGNYMDLRYDISSVDLAKVPHSDKAELFTSYKVVYVTLQPDEKGARVANVGLSPPTDGSLYMRGQIQWKTESTLNLIYGIERYYIPEVREEEVNQMGWDPDGQDLPKITVEVSVARDGTAYLLRVLKDGKPLGF